MCVNKNFFIYMYESETWIRIRHDFPIILLPTSWNEYVTTAVELQFKQLWSKKGVSIYEPGDPSGSV